MSQRELRQKTALQQGVGMVTSITSAITEIPVIKNVAMIAEITLRGLVLPIGGLKENF